MDFTKYSEHLQAAVAAIKAAAEERSLQNGGKVYGAGNNLTAVLYQILDAFEIQAGEDAARHFLRGLDQ